MRTFNYDNLRKVSWDSEILGLVAQIHEYKGRQEFFLRQKPAVLDRYEEFVYWDFSARVDKEFIKAYVTENL